MLYFELYCTMFLIIVCLQPNSFVPYSSNDHYYDYLYPMDAPLEPRASARVVFQNAPFLSSVLALPHFNPLHPLRTVHSNIPQMKIRAAITGRSTLLVFSSPEKTLSSSSKGLHNLLSVQWCHLMNGPSLFSSGD